MEIRYVGPYAEVELQGVRCKNGEEVTFPDAIAAQVLEQECWTASNVSLSVPVKSEGRKSTRPAQETK